MSSEAESESVEMGCVQPVTRATSYTLFRPAPPSGQERSKALTKLFAFKLSENGSGFVVGSVAYALALGGGIDLFINGANIAAGLLLGIGLLITFAGFERAFSRSTPAEEKRANDFVGWMFLTGAAGLTAFFAGVGCRDLASDHQWQKFGVALGIGVAALAFVAYCVSRWRAIVVEQAKADTALADGYVAY